MFFTHPAVCPTPHMKCDPQIHPLLIRPFNYLMLLNLVLHFAWHSDVLNTQLRRGIGIIYHVGFFDSYNEFGMFISCINT